jgi:hypothetical protein
MWSERTEKVGDEKTESQMPDPFIANPLKTDSQTERTTLKK